MRELHEGTDHGSGAIAAMDCEAPATTSSGTAHDDCDCSDTGCECACGFVTLALARGIPVVDTFWIGFVQASGRLTTAAQGSRSSLFRPPIA